ncbi:MAG: hypothetical protein V7638_3862 [Acidobacteriota bacterium]|jgi:hypothetical protein
MKLEIVDDEEATTAGAVALIQQQRGVLETFILGVIQQFEIDHAVTVTGVTFHRSRAAGVRRDQLEHVELDVEVPR